MKICKLCKKELPLNEFYFKDKIKKIYCSNCKSCQKIKSKQWGLDNPEKKRKSNKKWKVNNLEKVKESQKRCSKRYRLKHSEEIQKKLKNYYIKNPEETKKRSRQWVLDNPERQKENHKNWHLNHPGYDNKYSKNRRATDPIFKLKCILRNRIKSVLKGVYKSVNTEKLLMCSWEEARNHIKSKFKPGMSWDNHGLVWEIDHIIPCSFFNLEDPVELYMCCRWQNLQPLTIEENRKKFDNIL
jgi:hypothetical protein